MTTVALFLTVFLACAVEAVEATTIVLAAGTARDWPSALRGAGSGVVLLAVVIAALGPAVSALPLTALRLVVGGLLLVFGLQWLRKAILRAGGIGRCTTRSRSTAASSRQPERPARSTGRAWATGMRSPSPSKASSWRDSRSPSSPSPSAPMRTICRSRPWRLWPRSGWWRPAGSLSARRWRASRRTP